MKCGWIEEPFSEAVQNLKATAKIPRKRFETSGTYPVVSQERDEINGYWSKVEDVTKVDSPIVLFGDHTKALKFIDFDFVVGADGVKLLRPRSHIEPRFLYYFLQGVQIPDLGYARHFRLLREVTIRYPSEVAEQKRIVAILDEAFAGIDQAVKNTEQNLANARELFESELNRVFSEGLDGWQSEELAANVRFIDYRGRTPPKTESGMRLVTAKNVKMGRVQRDPEEFVDPSMYESWMTRGIPEEGDVLITTEAPLGNVAQLDTSQKVVFAQRVIVLQPDRERIAPSFLCYQLRSRSVQKSLQAESSGATAKGIKASRLKKILITYPLKIGDQTDLADRLAKLEIECGSAAEIATRKITELQNLKQSLLHRAFAGELTSETVDKSLVGATA